MGTFLDAIEKANRDKIRRRRWKLSVKSFSSNRKGRKLEGSGRLRKETNKILITNRNNFHGK